MDNTRLVIVWNFIITCTWVINNITINTLEGNNHIAPDGIIGGSKSKQILEVSKPTRGDFIQKFSSLVLLIVSNLAG